MREPTQTRGSGAASSARQDGSTNPGRTVRIIAVPRQRQPDPAPDPALVPATMDVGQAATYLGISKATLYTWRTRRPGFGPRAVKAGGALRYRRCDLDVWIEEHAEAPDQIPTIDDHAGEPTPPPSGPAEGSTSRRLRPAYLHPRRASSEW